MTTARLTHSDADGVPHMVDVSGKPETPRTATATGRVVCDAATYELLHDGGVAKGDVLAVARLAGITAAKQTSALIPLCHPLPLTHIDVDVHLDPDLPGIALSATARCVGRTGVEMEALVAVSVAGLTVIDMAKAADRWMHLEGIGLVHKDGGRSGLVERPADRPL